MTTLQGLADAAREAILLEAAEASAKALPDERREGVRVLAQAALDHLDAVASLVGPSTSAPACTLAREAVLLLLGAHARAAGREADAIWKEPRGALGEHPEVPEPAVVERALSGGTAPGWSVAGEAARREEIAALVAAAHALAAGLELRTPRQLRLARRSRLAAAAGVLLALVLVAFGVRARQPNLALRKVVTTSGLDPQSPDPAALVDGEPFGAFGVRTAADRSPWVMVDLGGSYAISDVIVYHRGDGATDEALPLVIESSIDAQSFVPIGRSHDRFSQDAPLRLVARGVRGRYVRVRLDRPGFLALTEIEVHGSR